MLIAVEMRASGEVRVPGLPSLPTGGGATKSALVGSPSIPSQLVSTKLSSGSSSMLVKVHPYSQPLPPAFWRSPLRSWKLRLQLYPHAPAAFATPLAFARVGQLAVEPSRLSEIIPPG